MPTPAAHRSGDTNRPLHSRLATFDAYDADVGDPAHRPPSSFIVQQQQQQQQPLRRRGGPVPAPSSLLSSRATALSTPREDPYEAASTITAASTQASSSRDSTTTSPPHGDASRQLNRTLRPAQQSAAARPVSPESREGSASAAAPPVSRRAHRRSSQSPAPAAAAAQQQQQQQRVDSQHPPRVPTTRAPGSSTVVASGPVIIRASSPAAASTHSVRPGKELDGRTGQAPLTRDSSPRSSSLTESSAPFRTRLPTQAPSPGNNSLPSYRSSAAAAAASSASVRAAARGGDAAVSGETDAQQEAKKELRRQRRDGEVRVQGYVAQSAYAQRNPFRSQDFAEFAANPQYHPPPGFDVYPQAIATRVYGLEVSRASQGEFMMQRLVNAAHPATSEERVEMEELLSATLEKLQVGDWFYKWARINHVHQRYVWLNLQRGTLMWSLSPKQSVVLNSEVKLSTVTSITPDCLQLEAPVRVFYRMTINTPDSCISLATEIRKKFDVWYRVLLQLTAPNLTHGVPGVWGRPSSSVNATGRGAASRWASRYSPLTAIADDVPGAIGSNEAYAHGVVSSSD
ncbi:Meiotic cell cortex pleckstrin like protein [Novymonas esmeraldas]|uniref:Meiotic cell cortex pleckstrin like protein n=1 Tax=Novymonas esmeraldas TaxID=1808958 RepID=A0AAW0F7F6_9TRYP